MSRNYDLFRLYDCDFTQFLPKEYLYAINLVYPSGLEFSFAIRSFPFIVTYLIMEMFGLASKLAPSSATITNNNRVLEAARFHLIIDKDSEFLDQWQSPYIIQIIIDAFIVQTGLFFHLIEIQKNGHGFVIDFFHNGEIDDEIFIRETRQYVNAMLLAASVKKDLMLPAEHKMAFLRPSDDSFFQAAYFNPQYLLTRVIFNVSLDL